MSRSEQQRGSASKRTPAEACEQAAELYLSIAEGEADGYARGTARLLGEAAERCRERGGDAPSAAGSVAVTPRALPAPEPAAEKPSASKFMRLVRAAQSALHYVPTTGAGVVYREELLAALEPFTPQPAAKRRKVQRPAAPLVAECPHGNPRDVCTDEDCYLAGRARDAAALPKRRGRPPKYGKLVPARGSRKDDPAVPHGMDDEPLELEPVADELDLDELRTVNE